MRVHDKARLPPSTLQWPDTTNPRPVAGLWPANLHDGFAKLLAKTRRTGKRQHWHFSSPFAKGEPRIAHAVPLSKKWLMLVIERVLESPARVSGFLACTTWLA